jgi:hypothetical protein
MDLPDLLASTDAEVVTGAGAQLYTIACACGRPATHPQQAGDGAAYGWRDQDAPYRCPP